MRPLRLEVEGLTSFREKVVVELDGLDLFALTGPTGAGKSTLIDALVLALYGQVPRVGREYKQLISHGSERLSVRLDFQVGGETYRVARAIRLSGTPQVRLERLQGGRAESLGGRVKEIEEQIEAIVGLDYDAFTRSVVLPQGQFDAFLKGKPEERRKILVSLLNLGVYERMHTLVNRRAVDTRREAEFIAGQLATDYAEATPDVLEARRLERTRAEEERTRLTRDLGCVDRGLVTAQAVRASRRELAVLERDLQVETERRSKAAAEREKAAGRRGELAAKLEALGQRQKTGFDEPRYVSLLEARPRAEQLSAVKPRRERLDGECRDLERALDGKKSELAAAEGRLPDLARGLDERRSAVETAREERESLRRRHAAHELRRHVKRGERCPVCEQVVARVPKGEAPALDAGDTAVTAAEAALESARRALEEARLHAKGLAGEMGALEKEKTQKRVLRDEVTAAHRGLADALEAAGFKALELADPDDLLSRITLELSALERARGERDRQEKERRRLETERTMLDTALAGFQAQEDSASRRIADLTSRGETAAAALAESRAALATLAHHEGWGFLTEGADEVQVLEDRRGALQREADSLTATLARVQEQIERLEQALARAGELLEKRKALDGEAALSSMLAQHLQANQFIGYVQEEALRLLADDGSRHLRTLSQGRYSLVCDAQDFEVIDHWNADRQRSVKTLSGGETFLASLALALALAERLAELSVAARAGEALESLFLDEGFGTLDPETLDVVVQALEALHGGRRMVGVVTHIQELAERLPARIHVGRSGTSATVSTS